MGCSAWGRHACQPASAALTGALGSVLMAPQYPLVVVHLRSRPVALSGKRGQAAGHARGCLSPGRTGHTSSTLSSASAGASAPAMPLTAWGCCWGSKS
jgi:hypothetical protein